MTATAAFAATSMFFALVQVFCLGSGAIGFSIGRPGYFVVLILNVLLAIMFARCFRRTAPDTSDDAGIEDQTAAVSRSTRAVSVVFMIIFGGVIVWYLFIYARLWHLAYLRPPYDWDGLYYHLPAIQGWVAQGRVCWVDNQVDLPFCNGYAMGVEVFTFFMHQILGHSRLVNAGNLWYWPLGYLALVAIAQRIGVRGYWRWIAGALFMGSPLLISLSVSCYIDAAFLCTMLAAIASALIVVFDNRGRTWPSLLLFGVSLGLMTGSKGIGVPSALIIMVLTLLARIIIDGSGEALKWLGRIFLAGLVVIAIGGYWYIRNTIMTGNPVFPIKLEIGELVLFDGYDTARMLAPNMPLYLQEKAAVLRPLFAWLHASYPTTGQEPTGSLGYIWIAGGLPAAVYLVLRQLLRRGTLSNAKGLLTPLLLIVLIVVLLFAISPARWWSRMTLFLHALGLPCLVLVLQQSVRNIARRIWPAAVAVLIAGVAGIAIWESHKVYLGEKQAGREVTSSGEGYVTTMDFCFKEMADIPGMDRFLASRRIARTAWGVQCIFMGGILSLPLDAREILYIDRDPDVGEIQHLLENDVEWLVWDCYNQWAPPGKQYEELPAILQEIAREELVYQTPWDCDLRFLRLR